MGAAGESIHDWDDDDLTWYGLGRVSETNV